MADRSSPAVRVARIRSQKRRSAQPGAGRREPHAIWSSVRATSLGRDAAQIAHSHLVEMAAAMLQDADAG
jgi:hypothetical protein